VLRAGLHLSDAHLVFAPEDEWKRDMRRRTFWLTLARVLIGAMLANRPPDLPPYDPRITAEYPTCSADSQVRLSASPLGRAALTLCPCVRLHRRPGAIRSTHSVTLPTRETLSTSLPPRRASSRQARTRCSVQLLKAAR
jgi:hypothetical protein